MLRHLHTNDNDRIVAGIGDDAAGYRYTGEGIVVQSLDVITPVVDDPHTFGAIAAANAMSDLYAMGCEPRWALNFAAFPVRSLPLSILENILVAGARKVEEAGAVVLGGHSIEDPCPKYGLAVTGFLPSERLVRKSTGAVGDRLFLTKPLGSGVLTTAHIEGRIDDEILQPALETMLVLNAGASRAMISVGVRACTDVTGHGLLGHLQDLCAASGVGARIWHERVPYLPGAEDLMSNGLASVGTENNWRALRDPVHWGRDVNETVQRLLCDAQTSGGLLIAVEETKAKQLQDALQEAGCPVAAEIGVLTESEHGLTVV